MPKTAIWVHGNIAQAEMPLGSPELASFGRYGARRGWGTTFYSTFEAWSTWFHFPMPTPVILNDIRPRLTKTFAFYQTHCAKITHIHIYDGPEKVKSFDGLSCSGDHKAGPSASNTWVITPPITILYGLGISVGVDYWKPPQMDPDWPWILFTTAGADFDMS